MSIKMLVIVVLLLFFKDYCSGDEENAQGQRSRRHSSPGESRTGSTAALHQTDYPDSVSRPFCLRMRACTLDNIDTIEYNAKRENEFRVK